jgi:hypothetical protein
MSAATLVRPQLYAWRWVAIAAAVTAGVAHIPVTGEHLEEALYMGVLFVLLTVACLTYAVAMVRTDAPVVYAAAAATCGAAIVGYALTRLIAFPMLADDVGNWFEPLGVVSVVTESIVVVVSLAALRSGRGAA